MRNFVPFFSWKFLGGKKISDLFPSPSAHSGGGQFVVQPSPFIVQSSLSHWLFSGRKKGGEGHQVKKTGPNLELTFRLE